MTISASTFVISHDWFQTFSIYMMMPFVMLAPLVLLLIPVALVWTLFYPQPVPDDMPYDFPLSRISKKGATKWLAWRFLLLMNAIAIVEAILIYAKSDLPQVRVIINPSASITAAVVWEIILFYTLYLAREWSASIRIDRNGIQSETWGESRAWAWKDIAM